MACKIIAEIGNNHGGDMDLAKEMILTAKLNGAWAIKGQIWSTNRLVSGQWDNDGRRELYEQGELTKEKIQLLKNYCDKVDIVFFASVFSIEDAKLLKEISNEYVKISSSEIRNTKLLKYVNENFKTVFLSTGTAKHMEITNACKSFDTATLVLFLCTSIYPCHPSDANLQKINWLNKRPHVRSVGFSDHCNGVEISKIAIARYRTPYIEKHFTIDMSLPFKDNKFSILPNELCELTEFANNCDIADQYLGLDYLPGEEDQRVNYSGRWDKQ